MNLLILGAGGHGQVVKETAVATDRYDQISFLDDHSPEAIGRLEDYEMLRSTHQEAFAAFGDNELRKLWIDKLRTAGFLLPVLIHPTSYVSPSAEIGEATIIEPMATINSRSRIGIGCIISVGVVIDHDCLIENYIHIDCGDAIKPRSHVATPQTLR